MSGFKPLKSNEIKDIKNNKKNKSKNKTTKSFSF